MKIAVVGSRDFPDLQMVTDYVNALPAGIIIVSGGAAGVDTTAEDAARARPGYHLIIFRPDWKRHGKDAAKIRNQKIVNECDLLVSFWTGNELSGSAQTQRMAEKAGKPVMKFLPKESS